MQKLIEQFKALPTWQRYFLLLGLPLVLVVYLWFMLLSPAMDEVSKLRVDVQNAKTDIERIKASLNPAILENLKKEEEALKEEYANKQAELESLVGEIPTERDVGKLISNLGRIAKKSKLTILNIQVSAPQKATYTMYQEGEKKIVRELQQQQQTQQAGQQAQQQPAQQPQEGLSFLRSEVKLTLLGSYTSLKTFLDGLRKEGIISYPLSLSLSSEGSNIKAEMVIYILMKEEGQIP